MSKLDKLTEKELRWYETYIEPYLSGRYHSTPLEYQITDKTIISARDALAQHYRSGGRVRDYDTEMLEFFIYFPKHYTVFEEDKLQDQLKKYYGFSEYATQNQKDSVKNELNRLIDTNYKPISKPMPFSKKDLRPDFYFDRMYGRVGDSITNGTIEDLDINITQSLPNSERYVATRILIPSLRSAIPTQTRRALALTERKGRKGSRSNPYI